MKIIHSVYGFHISTSGRIFIRYLTLLFIVYFNGILFLHTANATGETSDIEKCMQTNMLLAENTETIGELRHYCQKALIDAEKTTTEYNVNLRKKSQEVAWDNPFVVSVHKPNYVLFFAQNKDTNEAPFKEQFPNEDVTLDEAEVKFQISVKFPLALNLFERNDEIFFAYTNRSFWQLYKTESAPFRETNHEPEIFYSLKTNWKFFGFKNKFINMGLVHQSNGRGGTLSRSWNRIYTAFVLENNNWDFIFKPWYRIPEAEKQDENPDIENFMGNFEFTGVYTKGKHTFSAMFRNNLKSTDNHGAYQVDWVFPLSRYFSGYVQYFNGYGESLIDYNYKQESIGIGFALSGWL